MANKRSYSFEADIYSLGCLLFYLLTSSVLSAVFQRNERNDSSSVRMRLMHCRDTVCAHPSCSASAKDLILKLLALDPSDRPNLIGVQRHQFMNRAAYKSSALTDSGVVISHSQGSSHRPLIRSNSRSLDRASLRHRDTSAGHPRRRLHETDAIDSGDNLETTPVLTGRSVERITASNERHWLQPVEHQQQQRPTEFRRPFDRTTDVGYSSDHGFHHNRGRLSHRRTGSRESERLHSLEDRRRFHSPENQEEDKPFNAEAESHGLAVHCRSFRATGFCGGTCRRERQESHGHEKPGNSASYSQQSCSHPVQANLAEQNHHGQANCLDRGCGGPCLSSCTRKSCCEHNSEAAAIVSHSINNNGRSCSAHGQTSCVSCKTVPSLPCRTRHCDKQPSNSQVSAQDSLNSCPDSSSAINNVPYGKVVCTIRNEEGQCLSDLIPPISTNHLLPYAQEFSNRAVRILENGEVVGQFFEKKYGETPLVNSVLVVSPNGLTIKFYKPYAKEFIKDRAEPPMPILKTVEEFSYSNLPVKQWKKYLLIAAVVDNVKSKTVRLRYYHSDVKCSLYENENFEVHFLTSGGTFIDNIFEKKPDEGSFKLKSSKAGGISQDDFDACTKYLKKCKSLQAALENEELQTGEDAFPAVIGRLRIPVKDARSTCGTEKETFSQSVYQPVHSSNLRKATKKSSPSNASSTAIRDTGTSLSSMEKENIPSAVRSTSSESRIPKDSRSKPSFVDLSESRANVIPKSPGTLNPRTGEKEYYIVKFNCMASRTSDGQLRIKYHNSKEELLLAHNGAEVIYTDAKGRRMRYDVGQLPHNVKEKYSAVPQILQVVVPLENETMNNSN